MKDLFTPLIQKLCELYRIDPRPLLAGKSIMINGVRISLRHHQETLSPFMIMYCDFGQVPPEQEAAVLRLLLQLNFTAYTGQDETWCLTPDDHIVLANNFNMELLTPSLLATHLALASVRAKNWPHEYLQKIAPAEDTQAAHTMDGPKEGKAYG